MGSTKAKKKKKHAQGKKDFETGGSGRSTSTAIFTSDGPGLEFTGQPVSKNKPWPNIGKSDPRYETMMQNTELDYQQRVAASHAANQAEYDLTHPQAHEGVFNPATGKWESEVNPEVRTAFEAREIADKTSPAPGVLSYEEFLRTHKDPIGVKETETEKRELYNKMVEQNKTGFSITGEDITNTLMVELGMFGEIANLMGLGNLFKSKAAPLVKTTTSISSTGWMSPAIRTTTILQPAAKTVAGISVKKLAVIGGALLVGDKIASSDSLANWAALDNIDGQMSIMIRDVKQDMGGMTPEERKAALKNVEDAEKIAEAAEAKIIASTMYNPYSMINRNLWITSTEANKLSRQRNLEYIRNYDPLMDQWSRETSQAKEKKNLQTYGKPKYDEQGNPL